MRTTSARAAADLPSPAVLDNEQATLGGLLLEGLAAAVEVGAVVRLSDFYTEAHRLIYGAMHRLVDAGQSVDTLTVQAELVRVGDLEAAGGPAALALLEERGCIRANLMDYARLVADAGAKRETLARGLAFVEHCRNAHDLADLAAESNDLAAALAERTAGVRGGLPDPEVTADGDDLRVTWPARRVVVQVENLREHSDGIGGELVATRDGREIHAARLPLMSSSARATFVRACVAASPSAAWPAMIERACRLGVLHARQGEPVVVLEPRMARREPYLIEPLLPEGQTVVLFGDGGAGKSLLLLLLMISTATGKALPGFGRPARTGPALSLDWEGDQATWEELLALGAAGLGVQAGDLAGLIHYRPMTAALSDEGRRLRADCARLGVMLLGVDSLALASGPEPESADAAVRSLNTLRTLGPGVTKAVVSHVNKLQADQRAGRARPFGSVFVQNIARSTWEVRRTAEDTGDDLVMALYNAKTNRGRLHAPLALRAHFAPDAITLHPGTLADAPDLMARAPLSQQIRAALATGAKTIPALAAELDAKEDTIDKTLRRLRDRGVTVQLPGDKPPYPWGLAQR